MTETKPPVWPSYRARFILVALYALMSLYLIFGLEPLRTGQLTNIPADKLDRFDPIAELPALQRMVGPGAVYQGMSASGLRPDGTMNLRGQAHARYTFITPDGQGGHRRTQLSVWPPGLSGGGSKLVLRRRWERGISIYDLGAYEPAPAQPPACALPALITRAQRAAQLSGRLPTPLGDITLEHDGARYELTLKGVVASDASPVHTIERAGRGGSPAPSLYLVPAVSIAFDAGCEER